MAMRMTLTESARRPTDGMGPRTRRLCAALAVLVAVSAVPALFVEGILNETPVMNGSARGTSLTMFGLALPVLAVGLIQATAGAGLVFWVIEAIRVAVDQWSGHRAFPGCELATLAAAVMFSVLAAAPWPPWSSGCVRSAATHEGGLS